MVKHFTIGRFDIEISTNAHCAWRKLGNYHRDNVRHLVWGKLSLVVEDATAPVYPTCAQCGSGEIGERFAGDEGWTVCAECGAVEQGYKYLTKREWEAM